MPKAQEVSGMTTSILTSFTMFGAMVMKGALLNVSMIQQDIVIATTMLLLYFVKRVSAHVHARVCLSN